MIEYFLFDVDGTLFELSEPLYVTYQREIQSSGGSLSGDLSSHIYQVWKSMEPIYLNHANEYATSVEREREFWIDFATSVIEPFIKEKVVSETALRLYNHFSKKESRKLVDGVYEIFNAIQKKGKKIGVFTNNDSRTHHLIDAFELSKYLTHIFIAGELGFKKPSQKAFHKIIETVDVSADSIVMIGDDLERDCKAAKKAGLSAAFLNKRNENMNDQSILHLTTLHDVMGLLA